MNLHGVASLVDVRKLILALIAAPAFIWSNPAFSSGCDSENGISKLKARLIAVASVQSNGAAADGRKSIEELAVKTPKDEATQVALEAAQSLIAIMSVTRDGVRINDFGMSHLGSAYVMGNGCFVLTARHVPNRLKKLVVNGKMKLVPTEESPTGSEVEMKVGFGPGQVRTHAKGKVIYSGPSASNADHDFALIRLDRKARVRLLTVSAAEDSELVGAHMVSVGLPLELQTGGSLRAYSDVNCRGIPDSPKRRLSLVGSQLPAVEVRATQEVLSWRK